MTKGRLEAFSDGVIAIIITITILEIGLPEGDDMRALITILPLVVGPQDPMARCSGVGVGPA